MIWFSILRPSSLGSRTVLHSATPAVRGVFRSLQELKDAIHRFLDDANANPKPFTWTKDPNKIIAAVKRGHQRLESIHSLMIADKGL
jgi:hypothetical protein